MKSFSLKAILAAAAVTLSAASAQAATTGTVDLSSFATGAHTVTFAGDNDGALFGVAFAASSGITGITLDGLAFNSLPGGYFTLGPVGYVNAIHTLVISGSGSLTWGALSYNDAGALGTGFPIATGVPEPETLAMMLAGLVMVGSMARRRRFKG